MVMKTTKVVKNDHKRFFGNLKSEQRHTRFGVSLGLAKL